MILDKLKEYIDLIVGIFFMIYFFIVNIYSLLRFKYIFLILGFSLILYHFIKRFIIKKSLFYKITKKVVSLFLVVFFIVQGFMIFYPKSDLKNGCDYIIVLGALVNKNKISTSLKNRLDTCVQYLKKSEDDCYIVVSGGKGRGEYVTEAFAMKEYLISKGIDERKILMEDKSTTTRENFLFSKKLIENNSKDKIENLNIKVVTTDFHTLRSKLISYKAGYKNVNFYTAKSNYHLYILNYTREFFALICNIVFDY